MLSFLTIGTAVVKFFQMQTKQNMEIENMKQQQDEQKRKASKQTEFQIETEKNIIKLEDKIDHLDKKVDLVLQMMKELKDHGCGRCMDKG